MNALLAVEVDMAFGPVAAVMPHVQTGKLRAIATAAPFRLARHWEIPTISELGYPAVQVSDWQGVGAPIATPRAIIALHTAFSNILDSAGMREHLRVLGMEAADLNPESFEAIFAKIRRWNQLVRAAGIRAD